MCEQSFDKQVIETRLKAARQMVADLCKRRGEPGSRDWIMSIPVQQDDPDVVIGDSLSDVRTCLNEIDRLECENQALITLVCSTGDGGDDGCYVFENVIPPKNMLCEIPDSCEKCIQQWAKERVTRNDSTA